MKKSICSLAALAATLALAAPAWADVVIRVPFVRVQVGDGVYVRAPFVNLFVPSGPRVIMVPQAEQPPPPRQLPQQPEIIPEPLNKTPSVQPPPQPKPKKVETAPQPRTKKDEPPPPPKPKDDEAGPAPLGLPQVLTPDQFVKNFQPKAGNYEVTILNPVSNQATTVRFTLPEGRPRRVRVSGNQIEFDYGPRQYVRIRFDNDGAEVLSR